MNFTHLRKASLRIFIGFLALTALIAIVSVLRGEFDDFTIRVLLTCLAISISSILSMACAAYMERRGRPALGLTGISFAVLAGALAIIGIWAEINEDVFWKSMMTATLFAGSFAHAFLLALPDLKRKHARVQRAAAMTIAVLAVLLAAALWGEIDNEAYFRFVAVVAILLGLETVVIPILMKMQSGEGQSDDHERRRRLQLTERTDGLFEDSDGRVFRVESVDATDGHADD
jgi:hypothetical protein